MNIGNDNLKDISEHCARPPSAAEAASSCGGANYPEAGLKDIGWNDGWQEPFEPFARQGLVPARVVCEHRDAYDVSGATGELRAEISGRFRHEHTVRAEWPAVGDWVAVAARPEEGTATIHGVLPRRSRFSRKAAGERTDEQVVAANVDVVFLVSGLDGDFNIRRIERYLAVAWESGARAIIVLNKADLCADPARYVAEVESVAFGTPVLPMSAANDDGVDALRAVLSPGCTAAFLGSSGVGKSSLVNALLGSSRQSTHRVRGDDSRGRHTTTRRELIVVPGGGIVIDTPGMRELQLWSDEGGIGTAFADVEALAAKCRFADCRHDNEPGCMVRDALASGTLRPERFRSYRKLQREIEYTTLRQEQSARLIEKNRWRKVAREIRRLEKEKRIR